MLEACESCLCMFILEDQLVSVFSLFVESLSLNFTKALFFLLKKKLT